MGILRRCGRGLARAVAALLLAPVLALVPAALIDRGPGGAVRPTLFPAGLAASDPFLWDSARNSLVNAAVVTLGSLLVGVALARVVARWQFWGRTPLAAACCAAVAVPPACAALGVRLMFGPSGPWRGAWTQLASQVGLDPHAWAWVALGWVGLAGGVPLVALTTARALGRVEPAWEDAARQAGAGRRRVWRTIVRPMIRAEIARAGGAVFGLTLVEPGGPLLLGLRRTLAFQMVDAALGPAPAPRAAVLALAALGYALIGHAVLQWWGGEPAALADRRVGRTETAGPVRAPAFALVLTAAALLLWLPALGVCANALTPALSDPGRGMRLTPAALVRLARDADIQRLAAHSAALGAGVVAFGLLVSRGLRGRNGASFLVEWPEAVPPLVLGVGASVLPGVLQTAAAAARGSGRAVLQTTADLLEPYRTPGLLLFAAVATTCLPLLAHGATAGSTAAREAARQLGLPPGAARRLASARRARERFGVWFGAFVLGASNLAPALVLAPTSAARTVMPGLLILADQPGDGLNRAAALGACLIALNVVAFVLADGYSGRLERPGHDPVY